MRRIGLTLMAIALMASPVISQIINVPADQPSIQAGIDFATDGDTVLVADSTYYENINFKGKAITVASRFLMDDDTSHISKTIIDGSQAIDPDSASVVTITNAANSRSVLIGFTITGGAGSKVNYGGSDAIAGGGIIIRECGATIKYNIIENNILQSTWVGAGGLAIIPGDADTIYLLENIVRNNEVISDLITAAGGIWVVGAPQSSIYIHNNIISENKVSVEAEYKAIGGGISIETKYSYGADIQVYNNIIQKNELHCKSSHGGGIYVVYSHDTPAPLTTASVRIYNNLIMDNYSEDVGGGIAVWNMFYYGTGAKTPVDPVIMNNTIVNNLAAGGSGLYNYDAKTLFANNIVWNDLSIEGSGEIYNRDINYPDWGWKKDQNDGVLIGQYNNIQGGWEGSGNIDADPIFEIDSYSLAQGSPGIGHGIDSFEIDGDWFLPSITDFYGNSRPHPIDNRVDMGAIESPYEEFVYIPDTAFLSALIAVGVDTNGDGLISYGEAESVNSLDLNGSCCCGCQKDTQKSCNRCGEITSLIGIEAFINLDSLDCAGNLIEALDLATHTKMIYLNCSDNLLSELNVSMISTLKHLNCHGNCAVVSIYGYREPLLSDLDISGCIHLEVLDCSYNHLETLDLTNNNEITHLSCEYNSISSLDVSNLSILKYLDCSTNIAPWGLGGVNISDSLLSNLMVSGCSELEVLKCQGSKIETLDISGNLLLKEINLSQNSDLTKVCVWKLPFPPEGVTIDTIESPNVYFTNECSGVGIEEIHLSNLTIFPNPGNHMISVVTGYSDQCSFNITALNGQQLLMGEMEGSTHQIDLSSFQKGVYYITIRSKDFVTTKKIIKL